MIAAEGLVVSCGGRRVLGPLSLVIRGGTLVALSGRNGAGSTTALSSLASLLAPESDEVLLAGTPLAAISRAERGRRVFWLEQGARAASGLTVREAAVAAALAACGLTARVADRIVLMAEGQVVADGTARAVMTKEVAGCVFGVRFGTDDLPRLLP